MAAQQNSNPSVTPNKRRRGWLSLPVVSPRDVAGLEIAKSMFGFFIFGALMVGAFCATDSGILQAVVTLYVVENVLTFGFAFLLIGNVQCDGIKWYKVWFFCKFIPLLLAVVMPGLLGWLAGSFGVWILSFIGALICSMWLHTYSLSCVYEFINEYEKQKTNDDTETTNAAPIPATIDPDLQNDDKPVSHVTETKNTDENDETPAPTKNSV